MNRSSSTDSPNLLGKAILSGNNGRETGWQITTPSRRTSTRKTKPVP
nr:MAG TPA: hypothetical protein [Siphoviridae sp. ctELO16]